MLIRDKILLLVLLNQNCTIFSRIICLMFLIDVIKPNVLVFARLFRGGVSGAYKIKQVLLFLVLGLMAVTKTLFKRNEKKSFYMKLFLISAKKVIFPQIIIVIYFSKIFYLASFGNNSPERRFGKV